MDTSDYDPIPPRMKLLRFLFGLGVRILARVDITGVENIPPSGPALFIMNHLNVFDPVLALMVIPRGSWAFVADKWWNRPVIGHILRWSGRAIPVARGEVDRKALKQSLQALKEGSLLGLSPEGTRSPTGALQKAHTGVAYLASRSGAPIVPAAAYGQEKVFATLKRLRRPVITIIIGEPFMLDGVSKRARRPELETYTDQMMLRIAEMLPPQYRGYYGEDGVDALAD